MLKRELLPYYCLLIGLLCLVAVNVYGGSTDSHMDGQVELNARPEAHATATFPLELPGS